MYFDIAPFWFYCLTVAPLIGAVVLFGVHLSTLHKHRLESQKLQLEIQNLKKAQELSNRRIVVATTEETKEYNAPRFSRKYPDDDVCFSAKSDTERPPSELTFFDYVLIFFGAVVALYFLYDMYRAALWGWSFIKSF